MKASERRPLSESLARLNALAFGMVTGSVSGLALALATIVLVVRGGSNVGANLGLLSQYFPGYRVTAPGAVVGFVWAFLSVFVISVPAAWLYYRGVLHRIEKTRPATGHLDMFQGFAKVHVPTFAAAFGLLAGVSLFLATLWLVIKHQPGQPLGPHLSLLGQYLPGFETSLAGSVLGFVYFSLLGAAFFGCVGWLYNRLLSRDLRS